ncbi:MAG: DUF4307 domain-containing protein [Candidatus Planktophila sp.]
MSLDGSQYHFDYNDRYGVRSERAWVPYALSFILIGGAWILWAGLHHAEPAISYSVIAFDNTDPRNTQLRYSITRRDSSQPATCTIAARDIDKVIVGQLDDQIPASEGAIERTVIIASRADAVNAGVISCRLD